jgi:hypothetical protein
VGPAMEGINNALKTLPGHFASKRTVAKGGLERAVDVIPEALILPENLQDSCNSRECVLGPA